MSRRSLAVLGLLAGIAFRPTVLAEAVASFNTGQTLGIGAVSKNLDQFVQRYETNGTQFITVNENGKLAQAYGFTGTDDLKANNPFGDNKKYYLLTRDFFFDIVVNGHHLESNPSTERGRITNVFIGTKGILAVRRDTRDPAWFTLNIEQTVEAIRQVRNSGKTIVNVTVIKDVYTLRGWAQSNQISNWEVIGELGVYVFQNGTVTRGSTSDTQNSRVSDIVSGVATPAAPAPTVEAWYDGVKSDYPVSIVGNALHIGCINVPLDKAINAIYASTGTRL